MLHHKLKLSFPEADLIKSTGNKRLHTKFLTVLSLLTVIAVSSIFAPAQTNKPTAISSSSSFAVNQPIIAAGIWDFFSFLGFGSNDGQPPKPQRPPTPSILVDDENTAETDAYRAPTPETSLAAPCTSTNVVINVPPGGSIQAAINAANPNGGDTIQVAAGTYVEQLVVSKCVTITGDTRATTIIKSPASLANSTVTGATVAQSIVEVSGNYYVTMSKLTVTGPVNFTSTSNGFGIFVLGGSTLNLSDAAVTSIRENTLSGNQRGLAIAAGRNSLNQIGGLILDNVSVTDYQKGGIFVDGQGSAATISRTTVTGAGLTGVTAQNGIQISRGATGTIDNSTVSNNAYNNPSVATATGISPSNAGAISITNSTLTNNDAGIFNTVSPLPTPPATLPAFTVSGNTISNTDLTDTYGVILYGSNGNLTNNFITGTSYGILGYSGDTAVIDVHGNSITGASASGIDFENYPSTTTTNAQLSANFNRIAGNDYGAFNNTSSNFNAENNFWGCNTGPNTTGCDAAGAAGGTIDFDPFLILSRTAAAPQSPVNAGGTSTITTNLRFNSAGTDTFTAANHLPNPIPATPTSANSPNGIPVTFSATNGTVSPAVTPLVNGLASTTFTGGTVNGGDQMAVVTARVDNATDTANVTVLDATAPTVSSANVTSSTANTVTYTVVFSEAVTGVDATDFTVTTTGNVVASVTNVSGTGGTRAVTVTVSSGMGTIRLDVLDNNTIVDTASAMNPLNGAANNPTFNGQTANVDIQMPTVTINQATGQSDPTSSSPINFTVVFSEPVTGFTGSDVVFTGSTAGGTLTATVTGSGTTYNVAVSGMTTSGTVVASIPANAAFDSTNNGNAASSSTDNSVIYLLARVTRTRDNVTFTTIQGGIDDPGTVNGDTLLASPGVYNERIVINKSITIQGAQHGTLAKPRNNPNAESTIVVDNSGTVPVTLSADNVTLDGFDFDINRTFPTTNNGADKPGAIIVGNQIDGAFADGYQNISILNNRFIYSEANVDTPEDRNRGGISIATADNLLIEGNYLAGFPGQSVIVSDGSNNFIFRNNDTFNSTSSSVSTQGNFRRSGTQLKHNNVTIENNRIDRDDAVLFQIEGGTIRNNTFNGGQLGAGQIYLGGGNNNVNITTNTFALSRLQGVVSFDPGFGYGQNSNINVIGNTMTRLVSAVANGDNSATTGSFSAIDYRGTGGTNTIANNTLSLTGTLPAGGNSSYGIRLRGSASGNFNITGNNFDANNVAATGTTQPLVSGLYITSNQTGGTAGDSGAFPASSVVNVSCNTFTEFQNGVVGYNAAAGTVGGLTNGGNIKINNNNLIANTNFGINNGGTSATIDGTNNYWNSPDGPSGAGSGSGDAVSTNVTYTPFLTSPSMCAPINTVPAAQTINQDTMLTISQANGNQISVADADVLNNPVTITLSVTNGTLTLSQTSGLTVTGNGTANVTFSGTLANVNAALNGLKFTPNAGFVGTSTLTITSSSMGSPGVGGGTQTDTDTVTINVLDAIAPTVTINQASPGQSDPTSTSPINFTVVFSEPVTNFATGDVTVTGSAFGSNSTPSAIVTGSGTTYNVAVSGMTRSGTVMASLAAGVASDAQGNPSAASTSTDNTVFYNFVAVNPTNNTVSINPTNTSPAFPNSDSTLFFFANEGANGSGAFVTGPATPPLNTGSARLTIDSTGRENIGTVRYGGTRLADISSLQYSAYTNRTDGLTITLQFDVDYDLTDTNYTYQNRLVYEPAAQQIPVAANTWQTFDVLAGKFYSSANPNANPQTNPGILAGCTQATPCTVQQLLTAFPNVGIYGGTGANFQGPLLLRAGGPFAGGMVANADKLVVGVNGNTNTFDFEPTPPTISIGDATVSEGDSGTKTATFTITKSVASQLDTTVTVNTADGTATAGSDYQAIVNGTATIPANSLSTTVSVTVNGDVVFEPTETFTVNLSNAVNAAIADGEGLGTITNDDAQPTVSIANTAAGAEPNTPNTFTVTLSGQSSSAVTVNYATADGTAMAGSDYTATNGTITFAANTTTLTQTFNVPTLDDTAVEGTENFTAALSNASGASIGTNSATGTIADNDSTVQFNPAAYSSSDNTANTVPVTVTRTGTLTSAATVDYTTVNNNNSATGGGSCSTPGVDYINTSGTLNFAAGVSSQTFNVSVCQDANIEGNETVNLTLSNPQPSASVTLGMNSTAILTISDGANGGISISGTVTPASGVTNPNPGVLVTLSGVNMTSVTTTTNAAGFYSFSGLQSGLNYLVTPSKTDFAFEPINRSYTNLTVSVTDANFTAYNANAIPRQLRVGSPLRTAPGNQLTVPIILRSLGNENGISFTLDYDETRVAPVVNANGDYAVCGAGAPAGCSINSSIQTVGNNRVLVVNLDLPNGANPVFFSGSAANPTDRQAILINFNSVMSSFTPSFVTPLIFTDNPTPREITDGQNPLPAQYVDGQITVNNLEADVAPRETGDGVVTAGDSAQISRFVARLDTPSTVNNEFQRADCAPVGTGGDGRLTSGDSAQARRFAAALDGPQPASGPVAPIAARMFADSMIFDKSASDAVAANTTVRVVSISSSANSTIMVTLAIDAAGNENALGFSVMYDPNKLSLPSANRDDDVFVGTGAVDSTGTSADLTPNTQTVGKIGILLNFRANRMIVGGANKQLIRLRFKVSANAVNGEQTPLTFTDDPITREVVNTMIQTLSTDYTNGIVNILGPTAATATVGGRVTRASGKAVSAMIVTLTDVNGFTRNARTDLRGFYQFDGIPTGETYTINVSTKLYAGKPQVVTVLDNLTGVDFIF